ncbi:molecular chaperone [Acerihabitans sp.]|uniref:TorD/DmsD family molecular chaperone n=1 Tax=Acerihabitans sp. TaxID=2811394 RepID=UPI002ED993A0
MNDFSMVCRVLGTLFYRQPQDATLAPLMALIGEGKLAAHWPLEQDALLARLQQSCDPTALAGQYARLFAGDEAMVSPLRSAWLAADAGEVGAFLQQLGMPAGDGPADHFGALLLAGSWLEDHARLDETLAQRQLFDRFLLPWSDGFLAKVEACATGDFYRALAIVSREALEALREELDETPTA